MLRASLLDMPEDSEEMETLRDSQVVASFNHVAKDGFPLFLTLREFVFMLDGTLSKPFFSHEEDGSVPQHPDFVAENGEAVAIRTMVVISLFIGAVHFGSSFSSLYGYGVFCI
mmetsp:Transcript_15423/g.39375  ORF Transcript_15423/g.39375 Transcript_15423/m.39375 type:complete len:113 (-) Transcript_15423:5857-6195(-)